MLAVVMQVVIGLLIVLAVYRLSLWIMQQDKLVIDYRNNVKVKKAFRVLDGYADAHALSNRLYTTVNPGAPNYKAMPRSYNRLGGAQFSYSFWLFVDDTSPENVAHKTLIMRGDTREYAYSKTTRPPSDGIPIPGDEGGQGAARPTTISRTGTAIKCPRVSFGPTYDTLVVEFNTLHDVDQTVHINSFSAQGSDSTLRKNVLKLIEHKWVLFTFVFEDNVAINDFEDGIIMRFYVNDLLYHTARIKSTLRQNDGNFYLLPVKTGNTIKNTRIADVTYYNYAVSNLDIRGVYKQGPPKHYAKDVGGNNMGSPLWLSMYNEMDIYNT
jgi:hypothetical protein